MSDRKPMLSVAEALDFMLAAARPLAESEILPTLQANGRILAAPQSSALDVPPMDNSQMDGYAVRAADCAGAADARAPAGGPAHPGRPRRPAAAAGHGGAHLHRRHDSRRRRRGRHAGNVRAGPAGRRRLGERAPCAGSRRMDQAARRGYPRRQRHPCRRHAPARAGTGAGGIGRAGQPAGAAAPARRRVLYRRRTGDAGRSPQAWRHLQFQPFHPARPAGKPRLRDHRLRHRAGLAASHARHLAPGRRRA